MRPTSPCVLRSVGDCCDQPTVPSWHCCPFLSGILPDLAYWFKTTYVDAYLYGQSGFYPDGLICHHKHTKLGPYNAVSGHRPACDIAGKAYGFEWVAENVAMMHLGRGTPLYDVEVIRRSVGACLS